MIEFAVLSRETHFDVALAISKLGESHGQKLIPTRERAHALVAAIARHAAIEFVVRKKAYELANTVRPWFKGYLLRSRSRKSKPPKRQHREVYFGKAPNKSF